jgi:hypothetical protein
MWPFSNQKNPQNEANKYLDQIGPMLTQNYDPYLQAGRDPAAMQAKLMSGFEQNPGQRMAMDQALKQQRAYAGGQGMMGTSSQQLGAGRLAAALQNDNMQQYYNNNRDLFNTGLGATQSYTGDMSNLLGTQGQLGYNQAREDNTGWNDILQGILQGAAGAGMGYMTGGAPGAIAGGLGGLSGGMSQNKNSWDVNKFGQNMNNSKYGGFASNQQNQQGQQQPPMQQAQSPLYYPQASPFWR